MTRSSGFGQPLPYKHIDIEGNQASQRTATDTDSQLAQEGSRRSWRPMVTVIALLASVLFTGAAVLLSEVPLSSNLRRHRTDLAKMRDARDKNMTPLRTRLPDVSGSQFSNLWGLFAQQPATTNPPMPIPPSDGAVSATAVLAQQQLPASSALLATTSGGSYDQEPAWTGSPHQPITSSNSDSWSQVGSLPQDTSQLASPTNLGSNTLELLDTLAEPSHTASGSSLQEDVQTIPGNTWDPTSCSNVKDKVDFPGNDLGLPVLNASLEDCCNFCVLDQNCVAWTFVKVNKLCFLKGGHPRGALTAVSNPDTISGMPSKVGRSFPLIQRTAGQSLFCFSLMLPWGYEKGLLQFQYNNGQSIFGCDEYAVYSNQEIQVIDGVVTKIVDSNLHCKMGGEFGTCLNTPVFLAVWKKIIADDRPRLHDWTVKVDPDAVFFPARLRAVLVHHKETPRGIYLNNCRFGLHGPLEVFSRNAVATWAAGRETCVAHFNKLCSGPCKWGEDMFIDQCMWKVLKVSRAFEPNLLVEDHCAPPAGWKDCSDPTMVSFHPFKNLQDHENCMRSAEASIHLMFK